MGKDSKLEDRVSAMNPDQKASVRQNLAAAEANAKTPKDLQEIAQGYLLLDGSQPHQGENAFRVAQQLTEKDPKNPAGWRIAAEAKYQMGDLQAAKENALAALQLDRHDQNAFAVYMLSQHNVAGQKIDEDAIKHAFAIQTPEDLGGIAAYQGQSHRDPNAVINAAPKKVKLDAAVVPVATPASSKAPLPGSGQTKITFSNTSNAPLKLARKFVRPSNPSGPAGNPVPDYILLKQIRLATAHVPTGKTRHSKGSRELPPPAEFQIVKYPDDPGFYLLYLDERGKEQMDTLHDTIDAVLSQAKWEFKINPDEWTTLGPQPDSSGK